MSNGKILRTRWCASQSRLLLLLELSSDSGLLNLHFDWNFHRPLHNLLHNLWFNLLDIVGWHVAFLAVSSPSAPPVIVGLLNQQQLLRSSRTSQHLATSDKCFVFKHSVDHDETRKLHEEIIKGTTKGACRQERPLTAWMDNIKTWTRLPRKSQSE